MPLCFQNTTNLNLTLYLEPTVLAWLPCAYLWLCSIFYVPALIHTPSCNGWPDTSRRNAVKLCMWGKTVPMHVGQDGPHACGARRSPCIWSNTVPMHMSKTVPMHMEQDGPYTYGARQSPCIWSKTVPMHMEQDGPHAYGARWSPCMWGKTVPMHMEQDGPMHMEQDGPHTCGARQSPCMWSKTVPMHVGQDGTHACGARRSPCMWSKTVPMHVGQDGPHAYGARRSPCTWGKTVPMHVEQDGPHARGARRSPCMWGKTVPMHMGQDGPHAYGARRSTCMWGKTVPMHVGQDGPHACGARRSPCTWGKTVHMHVGQDGPHVLGACLCAIAAVELIKTLADGASGKQVVVAQYLKCVAYFATMMLATFLTHYEFRKGVISGGVLFFYWLLLCVFGFVPFFFNIIRLKNARQMSDFEPQGIDDTEMFHIVAFYVSYGLAFLQLLQSLFADVAARPEFRRSHSERQPLITQTCSQNASPETTSPFWMRMLFLWITKLVVTGFRRDLVFNDIWDLKPEDKCDDVVTRFEHEWKKELKETKWKMKRKTPSETTGDGDSPTERRCGNTKTSREDAKSPSILRVMLCTFRRDVAVGGVLKFSADLLSLIQPQMLNLLLTFIVTNDPVVWRGYCYVVAMFVVACTRTVLEQNYWYICLISSMHIRTALVGLIYRKALRLNSSARRYAGVGEIVNLMEVDAQKIQDASCFVHLIWSVPLTVTLCMYFLWQQLGPSVLAGLFLVLLMVPINGFFAHKTGKLQVTQMKHKDRRIHLMNELLNGIKALKLYAWENPFRDRVLRIRDKELHVLRTAALLNAGSAISWFMAPYLMALGSFAVYVLSSPDNVLDANKAFVSLSLFNIIRFSISYLPYTLSSGIQAAVSIGRIDEFLKSEELDPDNLNHDEGKGECRNNAREVITIDNGVFSWSQSEDPVLKNINLNVPRGSLVAIVGQVASGKSSLVSALLGEMQLVEGHVNVNGSVAYVPQQAWIQNATVKDNILFSKDFRESRYQKVIDACALRQDVDILPAGDETEIGENGINLSGGQKQRVSLARAVYQDCRVYLLDDPLSAVDAHVGRHIFDQVVGPNGLLKRKTRLLVTNSVAYLQQMDAIVVMKNGEVSEMGTLQELLSHKAAFAEFVLTYLNDPDEDDDLDPLLAEMKVHLMQDISDYIFSETSERLSEASSGTDLLNVQRRRRRRRHYSPKKIKTLEEDKTKKSLNKNSNQRLIAEELAMNGSVTWSMVASYLRHCGPIFWPGIILWYLLFIVSQTSTNIWLSKWSNDNSDANVSVDPFLRDRRLGIYGALGTLQGEERNTSSWWDDSQEGIAMLGQSFAIAIGCVNASRVLHSRLLYRMLRAPMSFFDTTPTGRIVNRFSKDVDTVDINIPLTVQVWTSTSASVIATIIIISYSTPIFLSVVLPLGLLYYFIQVMSPFQFCSTISYRSALLLRTGNVTLPGLLYYFVQGNITLPGLLYYFVQLKRINLISRSPIYAHFGETVTGTSSIRAYGQQERFIERSDFLVDESQKVYFLSTVCGRWLGVWLDFIASCVVLFAGLFAVLQRDTTSGGLAGLSISYTLQVTGELIMMARMTSDMEAYIVAVERINEYADLKEEAANVVDNKRPPLDWPQHGCVEFCDYATQYRLGLPLVLKGLNCRINAGEKVGIVGRTAAGKSSMTLALFRIIEATAGSIVIDDQVIGNIGLQDLRSKLTIIPQDPVLFTGPLRMNLDPFDRYTDEEVWRSLEHAHLKDYVMSFPSGLQHDCAEGGDNFSVGQRQLVCLARALLRKSRVLILDEATAAVDLKTDDLIQATICSEFVDSTVITIAHRLNTIMDYDRVLVLDNGSVSEFDAPEALLEEKDGIFYGMSKDAGLI
ncbi:Multidrug resistance-associated protein 1 [Lamellibrachia satsuma]|nr:Multidrug resistance-associated protein 1 [Lamellibrachia satsuma]